MRHQTPTLADTPPHLQLIQMGMGAWISRLVYAAARLGLADHLAQSPRSATELALLTGTHAPSLSRLMRTLASLGLFRQDDTQRFVLTALSEALRADAPGSARSTLMFLAGPAAWSSWGEIDTTLKTGETGFDRVYGKPVFEHLSENPDEARYFSEAMQGFHVGEPAAVAAAYDFSKFGTLVDVGGSTGGLLAEILSRYVGVHGVLFDLPHATHLAPALLKARGCEARITIETGSFFNRVPAGGDAYLLSHILHDWNQARCLEILDRCRQAMTPEARLLIVEMVLPEDDSPHPGKILDMAMMMMTGGQERSTTEYTTLLAEAGFCVTNLIPTASAVSLIEAVSA